MRNTDGCRRMIPLLFSHFSLFRNARRNVHLEKREFNGITHVPASVFHIYREEFRCSGIKPLQPDATDMLQRADKSIT